MSEIVERAAIGIRERTNIDADDALLFARAALLAALDPEGEAMVERVAKRMILARNSGDDRLAAFVLTWDREPAIADARAAISALRAMVLPNEPTPAPSATGNSEGGK